MSKHEHNTPQTVLCKFVRRGETLKKENLVFPEVKAKFSRKEAVAICMNSHIYFDLNLVERKQIVERLSGR